MNIGAKIKFLRKEKKVTQEELAEYLHISSQAVSKWETGASSPDIDLLPKLAIFFGTSLDMLLDFDQSQVDAAVEARLEEAGKAEDLCIDKLICMLWLRREEADERGKAELDRQAREMFAFFGSWPIYREITEIMEGLWNEGKIMEIYR